MKLDIFKKLSELRDKYPSNAKLIEEFVLIAFRNNGEIPKRDFKISGYNYAYYDILIILEELLNIDYEDVKITLRNETTFIQFKKNA